MTNKRKEHAICPNCGQWNYKPPTIYRSKVLDDMGIEHYVTYSIVKYKCICCKTVWSERWDFDEEGSDSE